MKRRQLDLFGPTKDDRDKKRLVRKLKRSVKGGLVNGMTKAQFRRRYPAKLPPVTVPR